METNKPVGWQYYQDGKWWYGDDRIKDHRKNTEEAGFPVRDLYVTPQPAMQAELVAWGAFYSGGKYSGQLHRHDFSEEQIDRYIAIAHRSNDSLTLRKGCLYTKPVLVEQQPMPDVGVLAEALDSILRGSKLDEFGNRDNDGINSAVWHGNTKDDLRRWQKVASNALAIYRNQGGEA